MTLDSTNMQRLVAAIALGIAFVVMASVFAPARSSGTEGDAADQGSTAVSVSGSLGVIEDDRYLIAIDATEHGPRYSVHRASDGALLDALLTAREVAELYPDVPISDLSASSKTTLMLADPHRDMPD